MGSSFISQPVCICHRPSVCQHWEHGCTPSDAASVRSLCRGGRKGYRGKCAGLALRSNTAVGRLPIHGSMDIFSCRPAWRDRVAVLSGICPAKPSPHVQQPLPHESQFVRRTPITALPPSPRCIRRLHHSRAIWRSVSCRLTRFLFRAWWRVIPVPCVGSYCTPV